MRPGQIEVWGAYARRFAQRHASARIAAVFSRSLHLQAGDDFLCLGDRSIGRGPLNAILGGEGWAARGGTCLAPGDAAVIDARSIRIGKLVIGICDAEPWHPATWLAAAEDRQRGAALECLLHLALKHAPTDGLARTVLAPASEPGSTLEHLARPRVARLRAWLDACRLSPPREPPPVDLLGLGPGLTPSGDDLLSGALVALHAVARRHEADVLAGTIAAAAPTQTSPLSGAFLRAAAEGLGAEPLHAVICAVLAGRTLTLPYDLQALDRIGHTSGWDALAGAVLVLKAFRTSLMRDAGVACLEISL